MGFELMETCRKVKPIRVSATSVPPGTGIAAAEAAAAAEPSPSDMSSSFVPSARRLLPFLVETGLMIDIVFVVVGNPPSPQRQHQRTQNNKLATMRKLDG